MTEASVSLDTLIESPEDSLREQRIVTYRLLAALLRDVPSPELLDGLAAGETGEGNEWQLLALAARSSSRQQIDDEFHELFIGLGRGELVPYGSWYLTGYLMEQPLALLRQDLARLGFQRDAGHSEPEDHIAALLEVMSLLLESGEPPSVQADFFHRHLAPWAPRFFADLQQARHAVFYRSVGRLGARFLDLEQQAWPSPP